MSWLGKLYQSSVGLFFMAAVVLPFNRPLYAQRLPGPEDLTTINSSGVERAPQDVTITIGVRDARGLPIDDMATVYLSSKMRGVHQTRDTKSSADVSFAVMEGPYEVQVECPGYRTVKQELTVYGGSAFFTAYVYLHAEGDPTTGNKMSPAVVFKPKAISEVDRGLAAMRRTQYESARNHFTKALSVSPNSDIFYLRGTAELSLKETEQARKDFEQAVALEPGHEKTLQALGQMQLDAGDPKGAIATVNRTFTANGAGWRTYYLLASAYFRLKQWNEASSAAVKSASLAHTHAAAPLLLLGDIQRAAGATGQAKESWEKLITTFPKDPLAIDAEKRIDEANSGSATQTGDQVEAVALPTEPAIIEERPWAPPDIDSKDYLVSAVSCNLDDVLQRAMFRIKGQLGNLEKFTATEHIEHQEIDKMGMAGPIKTRQFSYIVFVHPYQKNSVFLEESRDGQENTAAFPTSLATVGLNSLGISVLQPVYRPSFDYQCEGVATVRGDAAWQVRFEERKDAHPGVRRWQRLGTIYNIPIKGRLWLSTTTFDILRVETDLREPVAQLELAKDHLRVDYGPIKFAALNEQLWLPWNAEMYLELHGKRYHHRHVLSDYLLFGVDTNNRIAAPKKTPTDAGEDSEVQLPKPR